MHPFCSIAFSYCSLALALIWNRDPANNATVELVIANGREKVRQEGGDGNGEMQISGRFMLSLIFCVQISTSAPLTSTTVKTSVSTTLEASPVPALEGSSW